MISAAAGAGSTALSNVQDYFAQRKQDREVSMQQVRRHAGQQGEVSGERGTASTYSDVNKGLEVRRDLLNRYADYENMDEYPEISLALDMYADDATMFDPMTGNVLEIEAEDQEVKRLLDDLFRNRLKISEHIWSIARGIAKYGNEFQEILIGDDGVVDTAYIPPATMRRFEKQGEILVGYAQSLESQVDITAEKLEKVLEGEDNPSVGLQAVFEPYQIAHFRNMDRNRGGVYGVSLIEPARWIWKRLLMMEDAVLVYRLTRAPSRFEFDVEIGNKKGRQAQQRVREVKRRFTRQKYIDPETGNVDTRYSPLAHNEDFYIPMRQGQPMVDVHEHSGAMYQYMEDIEYFRKKLMATLKIPNEYTSFAEMIRDPNTLSSKDPRFTRSVLRLQRNVRNGLKRIARVHIAANGIDPATTDFDLFMVPPSNIFEKMRMEVKQTRASLARDMQDFVSDRWIMSNIFGFSDEEIDQIQDELDDEEGDDGGGRFASRERGNKRRIDENERRVEELKDQVEEIMDDNEDVKQKVEEAEEFMEQARANLFSSNGSGRMDMNPGAKRSDSRKRKQRNGFRK